MPALAGLPRWMAVSHVQCRQLNVQNDFISGQSKLFRYSVFRVLQRPTDKYSAVLLTCPVILETP